MMSDLLEYLCQLARLNLQEGKREEFSRKFSSLLTFIERIRETSASSDSAALHVTNEKLTLRSDAPHPFAEIQEINGSYAAGHIGNFVENER